MNNGPKAPCQGTIASGAELPMVNNFLHFQKSELSHNMAVSDVKVSRKFLQASRRLTRNANPIELQQRGKIEGILLVALAPRLVDNDAPRSNRRISRSGQHTLAV